MTGTWTRSPKIAGMFAYTDRLGGCILGTLWLLRRHALLWRPALVAGAVVAGINALALLANASQSWFGFDTAQSTWVFWGQQAGLAALILLAGSILLALVFMAAEGLTRLAFPGHPQLWRLWSREAAPTPAVLGRTVGGYLFVPIELALIAAFYFFTNRYLGWWQPSEALTDPNILGSALPALTVSMMYRVMGATGSRDPRVLVGALKQTAVIEVWWALLWTAGVLL